MKRLTALVLAMGIAMPALAQQTAITTQEVRAESADSLAAGDYARAATFADLILAVNPDDLDALILRARAALGMNDFATAKQLSKRAYRGTSNEDIKFISARLAALAHAELREDTFAQLWLRRARQFAPNDANAEQVARDYRFLANRNPWSTSLQFGITPSSNVNGGSEEDEFQEGFLRGGTFSVDARDLAGLETFAGFQTSYRLSANDKAATFLNFSGQVRAVSILQSDVDAENDKFEAEFDRGTAIAIANIQLIETQLETETDGERIATLRSRLQNNIDRAAATFRPQSVTGRDFSSAVLSTGVTHRRILIDGWDPTTFRLNTSHVWYGEEALSRSYSGLVSQGYNISDDFELSFQISTERKEVFDRENSDGYRVERLDGRISTAYRLANNDVISLSISHIDSESTNDNSNFEQNSISADYGFGRSFAGVRLGVGIGYSEKDFGFDFLSGQDRVDEIISVNGRARFTEIEFYGFQPEFSLSGSTTESVNSRFDTETFRVGFDLKSSF